jgi:hypothetical protein
MLFSIPTDEGFNFGASLILFLAAPLSLTTAVLVATSARKRGVRIAGVASSALWIVTVTLVFSGREIGAVEVLVLPSIALLSLLISGGVLLVIERHGQGSEV